MRLLSYVSTVLITGGVYLSGGFASNDIFWYPVSAVASLLFISKLDGVIMTVISVCFIVCFYLIDLLDLVVLPFDEITRSVHYRFANSIVVLLILFFLAWLLVRSNQHLQQIIKDIQSSQVRESISQDFHDELGNKLASVVHLSKRLKSVQNENDKVSMLGIIENESQQVYDNFRDFIWTNDPKSLNVSSLFMYLTDFNQQFFTHKDIQVEGELLLQNSNEGDNISSNIVRHIVPLFKEMMTNIYKHANASQVDWSLSWFDDQLTLKIHDNGIGFDPKLVQQGQGLKSVNKRVIELHGDYKLESNSLKGTRITLHIDTKKTYSNE